MTQEQIFPFIPQRPPFVMIDRIEYANETESVTSFCIREDHLFVEHGFFTEAGIIENMAQTAAAGTGLRAQQDNRPAPVGFIGALKGLQIYTLPVVGDMLQTRVSFVHQIMNAHIVQARVMTGEQEIAICELKIFLQMESSNT